MKKMIGLFAALLIMSFAIGWSASHPPGIEMETECIVMQDDVQIPVMEQEEFTMLYSYRAPALHHNAGDIQYRMAIQMVDDYQNADSLYVIQNSLAGISPDCLAMTNINNSYLQNQRKTLTEYTYSNEGLFRLDIGEIVLTT